MPKCLILLSVSLVGGLSDLSSHWCKDFAALGSHTAPLPDPNIVVAAFDLKTLILSIVYSRKSFIKPRHRTYIISPAPRCKRNVSLQSRLQLAELDDTAWNVLFLFTSSENAISGSSERERDHRALYGTEPGGRVSIFKLADFVHVIAPVWPLLL
jgi:hypothetical protein